MPTAHDPRELRNALGSFVTGVTVITALAADGTPCGVTVNSFTSVSLDPPLILWSQSLNAFSYPIFRDAGRFVVNILADDQVDISRRFSTPGLDRFAGLEYEPGIGGVPLLRGCIAHLQCLRESIYPGGDHAVFLGRVEDFTYQPLRPLAFIRGGYSVPCALPA